MKGLRGTKDQTEPKEVEIAGERVTEAEITIEEEIEIITKEEIEEAIKTEIIEKDRSAKSIKRILTLTKEDKSKRYESPILKRLSNLSGNFKRG